MRIEGSAFRHYITLALSLLPTPLLVFVSSSSAIYLKNQSLLQYQYLVLTPFAKFAFVTLLVGIALAVLSKYRRLFLYGLWVYYLAGPVFLLFGFFRPLQAKLPGLDVLYQTMAGLAFWPALLVVATIALERGLRTQSRATMTRAFAVFGLALFVYEAGSLLYHVLLRARPAANVLEGRQRAGKGNSLPNVYHLIFDAYQTDLFDHTLSPGAKESLGGFSYFPNTTAISAYTPMSLASTFSGRQYFYDQARGDYMTQAFSSEKSLLYWLKSQKYEIVGYGTNPWRRRDHFFDRMVTHGDAARDDLLALNTEAFRDLWLFSNIPLPLKPAVMRTTLFAQLNEQDLKLLEDGRLLPYSAPVTSYIGFRQMMADEESLSPTGRYTLVHVVIPHHPHKLGADCTYTLGSTRTGVIEQSECALKMVLEFIEHLENLGRFDDSLILIHGDHGGPYRTKNGELVTGARSRSLSAVLLIKPMGQARTGGLRVLDSELSLMDVPSVVIGSVAEARSSEPRTVPWDLNQRFVPLVEGELFESAQLILKRQGFSLGEVKESAHKSYPAGTVISQDPPAYQEGPNPEAIKIVLSTGHPGGADIMPDFVGRDITEVSGWLKQKKLPTSSIHHVVHAGAPEGMVVRQTPRAGADTKGSGKIAFYVSQGR